MDLQLRASDADRERVVATLSEQVGTGRLTLEEFSERSAMVYRSRTLGDLAALTRDLPVAAPVPAPSLASRPAFPPVLVVVAALAIVVVLGCTFLALASMGSMTHMMGR